MTVGLLVRSRAAAPAADATVADAEVLPRERRQAVPWVLGDVRRLLRVLALSGTGLVVAWVVASGTTDVAHQEQALAGGIVATAVAVAGLSGWVLAGMHRVRALRADAVQDVGVLLAARTRAADIPTAAGDLVTGAGMTHYHVATCLMVRGKVVRSVSAGRARGLTPCPVCVSEEVRP